MWNRHVLLWAFFFGFSQTVFAVDMNARDFFTAPVGTQLQVAYFGAARADGFHGPADSTGKADLSVNTFIYRYVYFSDICGVLCTPQIIIPVVDIKATTPGDSTQSKEKGIADPMVGGTYFLINDPTNRVYSGIFAAVSVPVGEYHSRDAAVSPGANRWAVHVNYNYTKGFGSKLVLEANAEVQVYGKNLDYYGRELNQDPLYRLQLISSYDLTNSTYAGLRFVYAKGASLEIDGAGINYSTVKYTQAGVELAHFLDRKNQIMVSAARNIDTDNSYHGSQFLFRFAHFF